jgi:chromosome segregation ATPase
MDSYGDGGASVSNMVDVYLCLDCGHYEFFSTKHAKRHYDEAKWIRDTESEIDTLRRELSELESPVTTQELNEEIKSIERQLTSLDITIRQQQELKTKLDDLKKQLSRIPSQISRIKEKIRSLESELSTRKHNFDLGNF